MMTERDFVMGIEYILEQQKKEQAFTNALQEYANDSDLTYFHTNHADWMVRFLARTLNTEDYDEALDLISWWLWDAPEAGKADDETCTISNPETGESWVVKTPSDLYNYIVSQDNSLDNHTIQTEAIKFTLNIIDNLRTDNTETHNEGWAERNALLQYTREKIVNEYRLKTDDFTDFDSDPNFILFAKGENGE